MNCLDICLEAVCGKQIEEELAEIEDEQALWELVNSSGPLSIEGLATAAPRKHNRGGSVSGKLGNKDCKGERG